MTSTVIIPAHNAEKWIEQAVTSAFGQICKPQEVIVASDGSTDSTVELARAAGAVVLDLPKGNANVARNAGFRVSSGEVVFFLDADDWFTPGKISRHLERHGSGDWSFVVDPATMVDESGVLGRLAGPPLGGALPYRAFLKRRYWYGGSSFSVKRQKLDELGGWREQLRSQQDIDLWIRLAHKFGPAFILDTSETMYRQTPNSTSRNPTLVMSNLTELCKGLGFLSHSELRTLRSHVIFTAADNLRFSEAAPLLAQAWDRAYDPRFLKAVVRSISKGRRSSEGQLLSQN